MKATVTAVAITALSSACGSKTSPIADAATTAPTEASADATVAPPEADVTVAPPEADTSTPPTTPPIGTSTPPTTTASDDASEAVDAVEPVEPDEPEEPTKPSKPVQPPIAIGDYTAPARLTGSERATRFPRGDVAAARAANKQGLEHHKAGDAAGALAAYRAAVEASAAYVPARYNLACELATSAEQASRDAAIGHLEDLLRIGSSDARGYVARAAFDPDFKALIEDARFKAIVGSVHFDDAEPFMAQLCDDPGRIGSLLDATRGFVDHVETEPTPDDKPGATETRQVVGKDAFQAASDAVKRMAGYLCDPMVMDDPDMTGSLKTYRLARAGEKDPICLAYDHQMEWSDKFLVCLSHEADGFRIASMAMSPTGPIEQETALAYAKRVRAARDQGLTLYGKSMKVE